MKKRSIVLGLLLALLAVLVSPVPISATNTGTQSASTIAASAIYIRAQDYATDVTSITFPAGAPGATVSTPYNDNITGSTQNFSATPGSAKPVVTLVNTADTTYNIWYNITAFSGSVVTSEYYLINDKGAACADADAITGVVTFGTDNTTGKTIGASSAGDAAKKDLYLKVTLSAVGSKTGTSTLTILGEN